MTLARVVAMPRSVEAAEAPAEEFAFKGPWFTAREAAAYVRCKSVGAWYQWRKRHGIVRTTMGTVAKADLDRALLPRRRVRKRMTAVQLANLRGQR